MVSYIRSRRAVQASTKQSAPGQSWEGMGVFILVRRSLRRPARPLRPSRRRACPRAACPCRRSTSSWRNDRAGRFVRSHSSRDRRRGGNSAVVRAMLHPTLSGISAAQSKRLRTEAHEHQAGGGDKGIRIGKHRGGSVYSRVRRQGGRHRARDDFLILPKVGQGSQGQTPVGDLEAAGMSG